MKWRKRKKAYDCSHHVYERFLVTDDPYNIYNTEDYCKLGKFDNTWERPENKLQLCDTCKRFCASRPMIQKQHKEKIRYKENMRYYKKNERIAFLQGVLQKDYELDFDFSLL